MKLLTKISSIRFSQNTPVETYKISVADWLTVPRCSIQRNEYIRGRRPHLKELVEAHQSVTMAIFPDGTMMKIDGHSRADKWRKGTLPRPEYLSVTVYSLPDLDAVERIYCYYDSTDAVKKAPDTVQSGLYKAGLEPKTPWLVSGQFGHALGMAADWSHSQINTKDKIALVREFSSEITKVDTLLLHKKRVPSAFFAAVILSVRKHGDKALPFWGMVNAATGTDVGGKKDAVKYLLEFINIERARGQMAGYANNDRQIAFALGAVERFLKGNKTAMRAPDSVRKDSYIPVPQRRVKSVRAGRGVELRA